uniref:Ribosomal protein S15 n=1 Tax=Romanomermis culicivorax TaxID=13658 RepID=A0A915JN70_ROMCU
MLSMEVLKSIARLKQNHKISCKRQLRINGVMRIVKKYNLTRQLVMPNRLTRSRPRNHF